MIAKLERTQSYAQQNNDEQRTPTTNGKKHQTTDQKQRGLNAFYWYQIVALDYVVVKAKPCLASM